MHLSTITNVHRCYSPQASAEQRQAIIALGGRPPWYLTPSQASKAIAALRFRASGGARRTAAPQRLAAEAAAS